MRLGAHISTAGGAYRAFERARGACCDSFLIFTKSNRQWAAKPFSDDDITFYKNAVAEYADLHPVSVHAAYLINVASPDPALWEKSYQALKDEVERAGALGVDFITFHPGSYMTSSEQEGLDAIARAMRRLLTETAESIIGTNTYVFFVPLAGQWDGRSIAKLLKQYRIDMWGWGYWNHEFFFHVRRDDAWFAQDVLLSAGVELLG